MPDNFDADYRSAATTEAPTSVLYVDDDESTMEALTEYVDSEQADVEVAGTTDTAVAVDEVSTDAWHCLVVGGDLSKDDRRRVVSAATCPIISFTAAGHDAAGDAAVVAADMALEKGTDERIFEMLVDKAREFAASDDEDEGDALSRALADVSDADSDLACFLVDEGELVWSTKPFDATFPADAPDDADFDDGLASLFGTVPDGQDDVLTLDVGSPAGQESSPAGQSDSSNRYYRHARHRLPGDAGGHRLEVFEDVTDDVEREASSRMHELLVEQARDGLYVFDAEGVLTFTNDAFASMLDYDAEELVGKHAAEIFAEGELNAAQRDIKNVVASDETGGEGDRTFLDSNGDPVPVSVNYTVLAGDEEFFNGFVCVARDVTERREREEELAARRDELARINRADALLQDVVREIGQASTRDELEQAVCDCLLDVEGVTMAWIGKREGANDRIVPGTVVGEPKQYLRDVFATTSVEDAKGGPVLRAVQSGEVQIANDFRENEMVSQWRDLALSYDIYSLAMLPLIHGDTVHGVLTVYGSEPDTFNEAMADRFNLLGDTIGFAMTAVQNKRLIEEDVAVELEFRSESPDAFLVWLARACNCRLETVGSVDLGDDVLQYLAVDGASVETVADAALDGDDVHGARVIRSEGSDAGVVELRVPSSLQTTLSDVGARLEAAVVTTGGTRVVVEAPSDGDVRAIHEVVRRSNPEAELVTKTEGERSGAGESDGLGVTDALTDRQREILQAAYLAGYYAWPRDTTAEELAESLDIASPTLHQHLRRAEHNILAALFDE